MARPRDYFLQIPAELRLHVYDYVLLPKYRSFPLYRFIPKITNAPQPWRLTLSQDYLDERSHKGQELDDQSQKWLGGPPNPLSMLHVCTQIYQEAFSVAYAYTCFRPSNNRAVAAMRLILPKALPFLTKIDLSEFSRIDEIDEDVKEFLERCAGLETIVVCDRIWDGLAAMDELEGEGDRAGRHELAKAHGRRVAEVFRGVVLSTRERRLHRKAEAHGDASLVVLTISSDEARRLYKENYEEIELYDEAALAHTSFWEVIDAMSRAEA